MSDVSQEARDLLAKHAGQHKDIEADALAAIQEALNWFSEYKNAFSKLDEEHDALNAKLQEAIRLMGPFARAGGSMSSRWKDHERNWHEASTSIPTVGDLRAIAKFVKENT